jgi:DNA end-binding protein Ku
MPRAIWSGSISFGLINIPVKLYTAVTRKTVSFNQIDSRTGARIRHEKVSATDGEPVPAEAIVKGYQLSSGNYVLVGDDELRALAPEASRTVDIEQFIDLSEIDPIFYDAPYYVVPDQAARKPYALLVQAMQEQNRVAVARFVMRSKQHLCAVRPYDGLLVLSTMVYPDEINDPAELGEFDELEDVNVSDKELKMASQLIESLTEEFEPERFEDTYRTQVLDMVERKAAGEEPVTAPEPVAEERVVDLMEALEASVAAAKESRQRHPSAKKAARSKTASKREAKAEPRRRSA